MAKHAPTSDPHAPVAVTIGILTYQRPESLVETLSSLIRCGAVVLPDQGNHTGGCPSFRVAEVVVIDNDAVPSAAEAVAAWSADNGLSGLVRHVHEPEPGLAAARNRALATATTPVLVFIDDDERAEGGWPGPLIEVLTTTGAALVGGPVLSEFDHEPPSWVADGRHFERENPGHGTEVPWLRSGNLAIDLTQTETVGLRFDPQFAFTGGEDVAFSRAAVAHGLELRWSARGAVTEVVGSDRTTVRWVANRARRSTAAYVRAHLATDPSLKRRLSTAARGFGRLGHGGATVAMGAVTLHYGRVVRGVALLHRGVGFLEGLLGRRGNTYGAGTRQFAHRPR